MGPIAIIALGELPLLIKKFNKSFFITFDNSTTVIDNQIVMN